MGRFSLFRKKAPREADTSPDTSASKAHRVLGAAPLNIDSPVSRRDQFGDITPTSSREDVGHASSVGGSSTRISILGLGPRHTDPNSNRASVFNARSSVGWTEWSDFVALRLGLEKGASEPKRDSVSQRAAQSPISNSREPFNISQERRGFTTPHVAHERHRRKDEPTIGAAQVTKTATQEHPNELNNFDFDLDDSDKHLSLTRSPSTISSSYGKPFMATSEPPITQSSKALRLLDMDNRPDGGGQTSKTKDQDRREAVSHGSDSPIRPTTPHGKRKLQKRRTKEQLRPSPVKTLQPESPVLGVQTPRPTRDQPSLYDHYEQMTWRQAMTRTSDPNLQRTSGAIFSLNGQEKRQYVATTPENRATTFLPVAENRRNASDTRTPPSQTRDANVSLTNKFGPETRNDSISIRSDASFTPLTNPPAVRTPPMLIADASLPGAQVSKPYVGPSASFSKRQSLPLARPTSKLPSSGDVRNTAQKVTEVPTFASVGLDESADSSEPRSILLFSQDSDSDYEDSLADSFGMLPTAAPSITASRMGDRTTLTELFQERRPHHATRGSKQPPRQKASDSSLSNLTAIREASAQPAHQAYARSNAHVQSRGGTADKSKRHGFHIENAQAVALPPAQKPSQIQEVHQDAKRVRKQSHGKGLRTSQASSGQLTPPLSPMSASLYFRPASSIEEADVPKRLISVTDEEERLLEALRRRQHKLADHPLLQMPGNSSEGTKVSKGSSAEVSKLSPGQHVEAVSPPGSKGMQSIREKDSSGAEKPTTGRTTPAKRSTSARLSSPRALPPSGEPEPQRSQTSRRTVLSTLSTTSAEPISQCRRSSFQLQPNGPPPSGSLPEVPRHSHSWRHSEMRPPAVRGRSSAQTQHEVPLYLDESEPASPFTETDDWDPARSEDYPEADAAELFTPDEMLDIPWPHHGHPETNTTGGEESPKPFSFFRSGNGSPSRDFRNHEESSTVMPRDMPRPDSPVSPCDFGFPLPQSYRQPNKARLSAVGPSTARSFEKQR